MNANRNPTKEQLKALLSSCDDNKGAHVLWVNPDGDVQISLIPDDLSIPEWDNSMGDEILFRFGSYSRGNGWVGSKAAQSGEHMDRIFNDIVNLWEEYCGTQ